MPGTDYKPSLEEVAAITLQRTADSLGNISGIFSSETRPTEEQAERIVEFALNDVIPMIGYQIPSNLWEGASNLVALRAAMLIEVTLYGQEIRNQISPYPYYKELFDTALVEIQEEVANEEAGGDPADQLSGNYARFAYPPAENLLWGEM